MNFVTEDVQKILAANIKYQRKKYTLSQEELGEIAGLSVQTINDIEGCRKWVSARTITKLAKALSVECFQLLLPDPALVRRDLTSTQRLMQLKEQVHSGVGREIESRFMDFIKGKLPG